MGHKMVPTVEVELVIKREKELNIRLNQNTGDWDWDKLESEFKLDDLLDWGFDAGDFGFDSDEPGHGEKEIDENIETDHECPKCGYKY